MPPVISSVLRDADPRFPFLHVTRRVEHGDFSLQQAPNAVDLFPQGKGDGHDGRERNPALFVDGSSTKSSMIYGVGIDLIETKRIEKELERSGDRFRETVFTPREIEYCSNRKSRSARCQCLAGRFSAKEAFFKAIGTGLRDGLRWQDVEVLNDDRGKPTLVLRNRALEMVEGNNITDIRLSISHTAEAATAIVILGT